MSVEIEYEKKIPAKVNLDEDDRRPQGDLHMIFVNLISLDKDDRVPNFATQLVQIGLA